MIKPSSTIDLGWKADARILRQTLCAIACVIALAGCGSSKPPPPKEEDIKRAIQEFVGGFGITVSSVADLTCEPASDKPGMLCSYTMMQSAHNYSTGQNTQTTLTPKNARFVKADDKWEFCNKDSSLPACEAK